MTNLPEKFPKGDHSNEDKREKAHIKLKTICFVRNQEHVVPQKMWWILLDLAAICHSTYFIKENHSVFSFWWYQFIWWEEGTM